MSWTDRKASHLGDSFTFFFGLLLFLFVSDASCNCNSIHMSHGPGQRYRKRNWEVYFAISEQQNEIERMQAHSVLRIVCTFLLLSAYNFSLALKSTTVAISNGIFAVWCIHSVHCCLDGRKNLFIMLSSAFFKRRRPCVCVLVQYYCILLSFVIFISFDLWDDNDLLSLVCLVDCYFSSGCFFCTWNVRKRRHTKDEKLI